MKTIESRKEIIEQRLNELFDINDKRKFSKEEQKRFGLNVTEILPVVRK